MATKGLFRRFFYWLGVAAAVAIVAVIIGGVLLVKKGASLDAEAKTYVDSAVVAICGKWDRQQLLDRASPEFMAAIKPEQLDALFASLSAAGALTKYEGANGQAKIMVYNGNERITAKYVAKALFEKNAATITLSLTKNGETWQISSFHVNLEPRPPDDTVQHI
ncbi:MAG TPA: hypothetical protein VL899_16410 [Alphaproteobacteria bacterium]|jgi:hypothetical protein|nr:hypothetical protein [Alphaproteobacteria bacterium]